MTLVGLGKYFNFPPEYSQVTSANLRMSIPYLLVSWFRMSYSHTVVLSMSLYTYAVSPWCTKSRINKWMDMNLFCRFFRRFHPTTLVLSMTFIAMIANNNGKPWIIVKHTEKYSVINNNSILTLWRKSGVLLFWWGKKLQRSKIRTWDFHWESKSYIHNA